MDTIAERNSKHTTKTVVGLLFAAIAIAAGIFVYYQLLTNILASDNYPDPPLLQLVAAAHLAALIAGCLAVAAVHHIANRFINEPLVDTVFAGTYWTIILLGIIAFLWTLLMVIGILPNGM